MKKGKLLLTVISIFFMFLFGGAQSVSEFEACCDSYSGYQQQKGQGVFEKDFDVDEGGLLQVYLRTGGEIKIKGWDKKSVSVKLAVNGRDAEEIESSMKKTGKGVLIEAESSGKSNIDAQIELVVFVPERYDAEFITMGGGVFLENIEGSLEGKTMGGELDLKDITGKLQVQTMGGDIELSSSEVDGSLKTMGGDVNLDSVTGGLTIKTMGGDIRQNNVNLAGNSDNEEVSITTMGGDIDVDKADNGAYVKTMGGDITVNSVKRKLEAKTMGGDIEVKEAEGMVTVKTMGGDIYVKVISDAGNGKDINLSSMSGDVTLILPAGFDMNLEAEIVYNKHERGDFKIEGDFDIKTSIKDLKNDSEKLVGKLSTSGANKKVHIKTFNGDITIKKG